LHNTGIEPIFPAWGLNTKQLSEDLVRNGFKAILTCIDEKKLAPEFSGKKYDLELLSSLPEGIDPCGENGEFHTFVYSCPLFREEIKVSIGEKISIGGFTYTDLISIK
jgi:diphthamide synthase (EF-2-diphthine--ammonia ligase)